MSPHKIVIAFGLVGCLVVAGASANDILFPKMTPDKGTFDAPFGKLGDKVTAPWSQTTVAAGVDGKPLKGEVKTIVGEIVATWFGSESSAGTVTCATITESTPAAMACRNGGSSIESR